jgi:hypothetical protein
MEKLIKHLHKQKSMQLDMDFRPPKIRYAT